MYAGGSGPLIPGTTTKVEEWDGTSWTETTDYSTTMYSPAGGGSSTVGLRGPGYSPAPAYFTQATEEWTVAPATKTVTSS